MTVTTTKRRKTGKGKEEAGREAADAVMAAMTVHGLQQLTGLATLNRLNHIQQQAAECKLIERQCAATRGEFLTRIQVLRAELALSTARTEELSAEIEITKERRLILEAQLELQRAGKSSLGA